MGCGSSTAATGEPTQEQLKAQQAPASNAPAAAPAPAAAKAPAVAVSNADEAAKTPAKKPVDAKKMEEAAKNAVSAKSMEVVNATAGVVAENLFGIAADFYPRLFAAHPGVVGMFNQSNQRSLAQPKALTDAIFNCVMALPKLDDPQMPALLDQIAHKHCALSVDPPGYKVVHDMFLASVANQLGDAVTDEVAAAWSEVVVAVSKVLIAREKAVYADAAARKGGWDPHKPKAFVVEEIEAPGGDESDIVGQTRSMYLKPQDGSEMPEWTPGQYITIMGGAVGAPEVAPRHYTISHKDRLRITYKRIEERDGAPAGEMTNFMWGLKAGDTLMLRPPLGTYTRQPLPEGFDEVYIASGIGITPAMSMTHDALSRGVKVLLVHMGECEGLYTEAEERIKAADNGSKAVRGHRELVPDMAKIVAEHGFDVEKAVFYIAGNHTMLESVAVVLKDHGVERGNMHLEGFAPMSRLPFEEVKGCPLGFK